MPKKQRKKPGPKPVIVKIEGDWIDALKRALHIKRPKEWPSQKPDPPETPRPKTDSEDDEHG